MRGTSLNKENNRKTSTLTHGKVISLIEGKVSVRELLKTLTFQTDLWDEVFLFATAPLSRIMHSSHGLYGLFLTYRITEGVVSFIHICYIIMPFPG
jgi:hypothetical protein